MEEDTWNKITDLRANGTLSPFFLNYFSVMELSSLFFENLSLFIPESDGGISILDDSLGID